MLKSCISFLLIATAILLTSSNLSAAHIEFEQTKLFAEVSAKASSEHKSFFVYFSANWCGPCQIMDKTAFKDENLANFIDDHVIPVKVDVDQTIGQIWKDEFNVTAVPTIIFFDQYGNETERVTSGISGTKLLAILAYLDPNHIPANVDLRAATELNHQPVERQTTFYYTPSDVDKVYTTFELDLGNFVAKSDYEFHMDALAERYARHRFYVIERRIPNGNKILQLILSGFNNEAEAKAEAAYLKDKNYTAKMVKM